MTATRRHQRIPRRGEERRVALLEALEGLLETRPLAQIGIGDIASAAGVTRPAFYFYFPTKAAAVAALLEDLYEEAFEASGRWHAVEGPAEEELRAGYDAIIAFARERARLLVAMYDAAGTDSEVREVWESRLVAPLAVHVGRKIDEERRAGRAPDGVDPAVVAEMLVLLNERAIEREVRAMARGEEPSDAVGDALYEIWRRTIYGT